MFLVVLVLVAAAAATQASALHENLFSDEEYSRELVSPSLVQLRGADDEHHLQLDAFGENYNLRLKRAEIFSPNFKLFSARVMPDGQSSLTEHEFNEREVGDIYSVEDGPGSFSFRDGDISQMEGILADGIVLKPTGDSEFSHVIYRQKKIHGTSFINDAITPPAATQTRPLSRLGTGEETRQGQEAMVELLVLVDSNNAIHVKKNYADINRYMGIFWNSVQSRYGSTSNPNVKISLVGVVVFNSSAEEAFVGKSEIPGLPTNQVIAKTLLEGLKEWLAPKGFKFDAAMLHTGLDAGEINDNQFDSSIAGLAYLDAICKPDGQSSSFSEDKLFTFNGVLTAVHELGHTLGLPHDGTAEASGCTPDTNDIMSPGGSEEGWNFSPCSLSILQQSLTQDKAPCVYTLQSEVSVPLSTDLPASFAVSLDEQCKLQHNDNTYIFRGKMEPKICKHMFCGPPQAESQSSSRGPAIEGTPCGVRVMCMAGDCVSSNVLRLDDQCKQKFGDSSTATNKANPSVCSQLKCSNGGTIKAQEGSFCGNGGMCKKGQCAGQMLSLDEQCARDFGAGYRVAASRKSPDKVCQKLWCTPNDQNMNSFGGADALSTCDAGKVCNDEVCVDIY